MENVSILRLLLNKNHITMRSKENENSKAESLAFDDYYKSYNSLLQKNLRFLTLGGNISYFAEYKMTICKKLLGESPKKILEYGCGIGNNIGFLVQLFPFSEIYGCDTSEKSLAIAKERFGKVNFFLISEPQPQTPRFDVILIADVLHHIPEKNRDYYMKIIDDLLEPNGKLVFFEHNPYNPVTNFLVKTCPFDDKAQLITKNQLKKMLLHHGYQTLESGYCMFFPEFLKFFNRFEKRLSGVPLGGKYYVITSKTH